MPKDVVGRMAFSPGGILDSGKVPKKMAVEIEPWLDSLERSG